MNTPILEMVNVNYTTNYYGVDIDCTNTTLSAGPGLATDYSISIENLGNAEDTYNLAIDGLPAGWIASFPLAITISAFTTDSFILSITPPAGSYWTDASVTVTADSTEDPLQVDSLLTTTTSVFMWSLVRTPNNRGLNHVAWFSMSSTTASDVVAIIEAVDPGDTTMLEGYTISYWDVTDGIYKGYIAGFHTPGSAHDFAIIPGDALVVQVATNTTVALPP